MLSYDDSARIRVSLLLSALVGLVPALALKGRDHDPMRYVSGWSAESHSAVFVIAGGAVLSTCVVFVLGRRGFWKWWPFALTGAVVGMLPGLVYLWATMGHPEWLPLLLAMVLVGAIWGTLVTTGMFFVLKPRAGKSGA
jgi:hypothetical protein